MNEDYRSVRISYSGKGELRIPEGVDEGIEHDVYVRMEPVSTRTAKVRIKSVLYATPKIVSP